FVASATFLLAGGVAALGITTRLRTTVVFGGTAMRSGRRPNGPEQADQCRQQHRSQVHPHDFRLLIGTRANSVNASTWGSGSGVLKVRPSEAAIPKTVRLQSSLLHVRRRTSAGQTDAAGPPQAFLGPSPSIGSDGLLVLESEGGLQGVG